MHQINVLGRETDPLKFKILFAFQYYLMNITCKSRFNQLKLYLHTYIIYLYKNGENFLSLFEYNFQKMCVLFIVATANKELVKLIKNYFTN